jgi:hypothetical protein
MEETIFVQIAAYRDPELIPTVKDCIAKAAKPGRLRFCIGWQYADGENIDELTGIPHVNILKVPYKETKGACWIRRKIQDQYNNETYTLQLDSHHRFAEDWDVKTIKMFKSLKKRGIKKPLLTSYLPSYEPANDPAGRVKEVWQINYDRFLPEGPIFLRPSVMKDWEKMHEPSPCRALSAHFIFTLGKWCKEVPYDPELYFHGEEISLAVRSFTHGYDLFHPHRAIVWHQYTRAGAKKHWDDNTDWGVLNSLSYKRVKILLGVDGEDPKQIDFKECGLGTARTLQEFERFAGVEFKKRRFHKDVISEQLPPIKYIDEETFQKELVSRFKHCIDVYRPDLPETDYDFWCVVFKDEQNQDMFRKDADENEIKSIIDNLPDDKFVHIWREFDTDVKPYKWTIWPHSKSKGWNTKILENTISYQ